MQSARITARLVCLLLLLGSAGPAWSAEPIEPMLVASGAPPLARLAGRIGGQRVRAKSVLPPGTDPMAFRPSDRRLGQLVEARLYVGAGLSFESAWVEALRSANPRMAVVDAADGTPRDPEQSGYLWTSPPLTKQLAWRIRDALSALDPPSKAYYRARTATLSRDLDALDRALRGSLAGVAQRRFLAAEPVWGPFAQTYGLIQVVADQGTRAGPDAAAALASQARREGARVIVVRPGSDPQVAADIAARGGVRVYSLDPMAADTGAVLTRLAGFIRDAESR